MDSIKFNIQLEEKDSLDFAKLHLFQSQKLFVYFFVVFTAIFIIVGITKIIAGNVEYTNYLMMIVAPIMFAVFYSSMMRTSRNNFKSKEIGKIIMEYSFDDEGIDQKSDDYENHVMWQDIFKAIESRTLVVLYVSKRQAMTIPKDKIPPETLDSLKNLIRKSIDVKKNKLK